MKITATHYDYEFSESEQRALVGVHRLLETIVRLEGPNSHYYDCLCLIDNLCTDIEYRFWDEEPEDG